MGNKANNSLVSKQTACHSQSLGMTMFPCASPMGVLRRYIWWMLAPLNTSRYKDDKAFWYKKRHCMGSCIPYRCISSLLSMISPGCRKAPLWGWHKNLGQGSRSCICDYGQRVSAWQMSWILQTAERKPWHWSNQGLWSPAHILKLPSVMYMQHMGRTCRLKHSYTCKPSLEMKQPDLLCKSLVWFCPMLRQIKWL